VKLLRTTKGEASVIDEVAAERQRVGRAISRMDKALKFELLLAVVSVGIGASLHAGGLI